MSDKPKAKLLDLRIVELSGVDRPCHAPATVALMKRAPGAPGQTLQDLAMKADRERIALLEEALSVEKLRSAGLDAALALSKSTRSAQVPHGGDMQTKLVILSEAQHAHYSKLSATEQEAFVNKSAIDRDADVQKALASDPVVFKGDITGIEVRKSQGDFAKKLAEQAESLAKQSAAQAEAIAKRDAEIKKAAVRKLATEVLGKAAPGDDETHDFIVEALMGNDKAMTALKGLVASSRISKAAAGESGGAEPKDESASEKLDAITMKYMTDHKVDRPTARVEVLKTAEGKRLYAESIGRA